MLGLVSKPHALNQLGLLFTRKSIAGSAIGGIKSTQQMLEFCAKHQILPDYHLIEANEIEDVWSKLAKSNADGVRYVIDIQKSLKNINFMPIQGDAEIDQEMRLFEEAETVSPDLREKLSCLIDTV